MNMDSGLVAATIKQDVARNFRVNDYELDRDLFEITHIVQLGQRAWLCIVHPDPSGAWCEWAMFNGRDFINSNEGYSGQATALYMALRYADQFNLL